MSQIIAYDICRLFIGPYFATPRGIDRVDLAVANHLFADPDSPHLAVLPTPFGVRAYPARTARLLLDCLHGLWQEETRDADDAPLRGLVASIHSPLSARAAQLLGAPHLSRRQSMARMLALMRHIGMSPGRAAERAVPVGAVYVNLGQLALAVPMFFRWLHRRPDVACALMIHDTIPLDHAELVKPASVAHHARMIRTAAAHADGLIFSTAFAQESVDAALARAHIDPLPSLVRALPVPAPFAAACEPLPALADRKYFVVVSTIEPRKNFGLLLRVWRSLIVRMGTAAPHLVIVGAPGLEAERILAPLAASAALRERVHQVSGLSSPTLARLLSGAAQPVIRRRVRAASAGGNCHGRADDRFRHPLPPRNCAADNDAARSRRRGGLGGSDRGDTPGWAASQPACSCPDDRSRLRRGHSHLSDLADTKGAYRPGSLISPGADRRIRRARAEGRACGTG